MERVQPPKGVYRYVNRVMVWALSSPRRSRRLGEHLLLLHVTGRKTGRVLTMPVGHRPGPDGRLIVLTAAQWRVKAGRQMGIRINVDRVPTVDELEEAVRREGLAVIHLTLEA